MSFFIDTGNTTDIIEPLTLPSHSLIDSDSTIKDILNEYKQSLTTKNYSKPENKNAFDKFYNEMGWSRNLVKLNKQTKKVLDDVDSSESRRDVDKLLKKSILTSEFESLKQVPPYEVAEKHLKMQRRKEREKTKGAKWYGLPATEMTKEIRDELQVLQMRSVLDPKRFYKKNDLKVLPKYFQIGKVMDSPLEFYNNRLIKKERKKTLVDELLADAEFNKYNKRKYKEIIQDKRNKAWKEAKKRKRNKNKK